MGIVFTRRATALPGKREEAFQFLRARADAMNKELGVKAEVHVRLGGEFGQMLLIVEHKTLQDVETIERKLLGEFATDKHADSAGHRIWDHIEDAIWVTPNK
jgi:hypothetical protein